MARKPTRTKKALMPTVSLVGVAPSLTNPDAVKDNPITIEYGVSPLTKYRQETNLLNRRRMLYEFTMRSTAASSLADSISSEIAAQEVYITPTESNPSASTLLLAQRGVDIINNAMGKPDGMMDFIKIFVESYYFSKTGAFILIPRDSTGQIASIGILNPVRPYPYYGWMKDYNGRDVPMVEKRYDSDGNLIETVQGIWYTEGSAYFAIPKGQYHQIAPGAYGSGGFIDAIPPAEHMLAKILTHTVLVEYILDTVLCTDASQAVIWSNVDPAVLQVHSARRKEIRRRRANGQRIDSDDEGTRLHVTAREPDKPADAKTVNFRAFPEGFDPMVAMTTLEQGIALGFGAQPRRISPGINSERFGNAQQAAMLNSDEPGVRAIKHALTQFYSGVLMSGQALRADFMAINSPENYAVVSKDVAVAQVISQIGAYMSKNQIQAYLLRQGLILPSEAGIPSMRTGDGAKAESSVRPKGHASLRWSDGTPITQIKPIIISTRAVKADIDADLDLAECILEATARYEDWMINELPDVVDNQGIGRRALEDEVDDLAQQIYSWMALCARKNIGNIRLPEARKVMDIIKESWFNSIGSPQIRGAGQTKPSNNLFNSLWEANGRISSMERETAIKALQQIAARFTAYIARYYRSMRAVKYAVEMQDDDSPVIWIRNADESCPDCRKYEGRYTSYKAMLRITGGLQPGDLRLTCSGNCKCKLAREGA